MSIYTFNNSLGQNIYNLLKVLFKSEHWCYLPSTADKLTFFVNWPDSSVNFIKRIQVTSKPFVVEVYFEDHFDLNCLRNY